MRLGERLTLGVAALIGLFGFVMIAGVLIGTIERTSRYSLTTNTLLTFLFGVLPLAGSLFLYFRVRGAVAGRKREEKEAAVLRVARERQGIVTAVDVAADCSMSLEEAQEILDRLQRGGFSEMDVSDTGMVVYRFRL